MHLFHQNLIQIQGQIQSVSLQKAFANPNEIENI
jgi:hypothetical protein